MSFKLLSIYISLLIIVTSKAYAVTITSGMIPFIEGADANAIYNSDQTTLQASDSTTYTISIQENQTLDVVQNSIVSYSGLAGADLDSAAIRTFDAEDAVFSKVLTINGSVLQGNASNAIKNVQATTLANEDNIALTINATATIIGNIDLTKDRTADGGDINGDGATLNIEGNPIIQGDIKHIQFLNFGTTDPCLNYQVTSTLTNITNIAVIGGSQVSLNSAIIMLPSSSAGSLNVAVLGEATIASTMIGAAGITATIEGILKVNPAGMISDFTEVNLDSTGKLNVSGKIENITSELNMNDQSTIIVSSTGEINGSECLKSSNSTLDLIDNSIFSFVNIGLDGITNIGNNANMQASGVLINDGTLYVYQTLFFVFLICIFKM